VTSFVDLTKSAAKAAPPTDTGLDLWQVVVAVGVIVGLIAGLQQLAGWVRRRRYQRAEELVLRIASQQLEAAAAKEDFAKYQALKENLRRQVEEEVPREARRVYLRSRVDALNQQIGSDVEEYLVVEQALADLERRAPATLDNRLRAVIESSIRPAYIRRRQTDRVVLGGLVALLVLTLSPINLAAQLRDLLFVLGNPDDATDSKVAFVVMLGVGLFAACGSLGARYRLSATRRLGKTSLTTLGIAMVLATCVLAVGIEERFRAQTLNAAARTHVDHVHQDRVDTGSAVLLGVGIPATGLGIGLLGWCFISARRKSAVA
jgi:hypothetical protein